MLSALITRGGNCDQVPIRRPGWRHSNFGDEKLVSETASQFAFPRSIQICKHQCLFSRCVVLANERDLFPVRRKCYARSQIAEYFSRRPAKHRKLKECAVWIDLIDRNVIDAVAVVAECDAPIGHIRGRDNHHVARRRDLTNPKTPPFALDNLMNDIFSVRRNYRTGCLPRRGEAGDIVGLEGLFTTR